jgi:hypothetical protein
MVVVVIIVVVVVATNGHALRALWSTRLATQGALRVGRFDAIIVPTLVAATMPPPQRETRISAIAVVNIRSVMQM